jgi:hypothetical protein
MWLYEVTIGHNNKLFHPGWIGEGAGTWLTNDIMGNIDNTWSWAAWYMEVIILPYVVFWSYAITTLQVIIAISLIFGVLGRPINYIAVGMMLVILTTGHSRIPPYFLIGSLILLATHSSTHFGIDKLLLEKFKSNKFITGLVNFDIINKKTIPYLIPLITMLAIYFFLQISYMGTSGYRNVSLDLAVIFGLISFGYMFREKYDLTILTSSLVRIFVGYKFLHEIFVRPLVSPYVNGLIGYNALTGQSATEGFTNAFSFVADKHWSLFALISEYVFVPYAFIWVHIFGLLQLIVGFMLIFGWKTPIANKVGAGYLVFLIIFGFTRYTPFLLGILLFSYLLNGNKALSFDEKTIESGTEEYFSFSPIQTLVLGGTFIITFFIATFSGIEIGDYRENMGGVMAAMVSLLSFSLFIPALLQNDYVNKFKQKYILKSITT